MDRDKAVAMLTEAKAELQTARSAVTYLEQVVSGLEGLLKTAPVQPVSSVEHVHARPPADDLDSKPLQPSGQSPTDEREYLRTPDAVLEVLRGRPNLPMSFKVIWHEIHDRGLIDPRLKSGRNTYNVAARRLADNPKSSVVRDELGRYIYRTEPAPDVQPSELNSRPLQAVNTS